MENKKGFNIEVPSGRKILLFIAAAVSTIILSLLISMAIRKIPGFGRIFD